MNVLNKHPPTENAVIKMKINALSDKKTNKNRRGESVRDCGYCKRRDTYLSVKCN